MRKFYFALCATIFLIGDLFAQTGALILTGPEYYQVTALSANGKWACGAYSDGSSTPMAFRWDLTTGEILTLSAIGESSTAYDVSDNGVVVGTFPDTESTENKAPVETAGYWKDGKWHHLETIDGEFITHSDYGGQAICISKDGRHIGGALYNKNKKYMPVSWTDGKLDRVYGEYVGVVYDISEDGKIACGWAEHPQAGNRTYCLWTPEPNFLNIKDASPWSVIRSISPDNKNLLCRDYIYNIETETWTRIPYYSKNVMDFELYNLIDNNIAIGYEGDEGGNPYGIIYKDGETKILKEYLESQGVVFNSNLVALTQGADISEDGNTFAVMVYNQGEVYMEFRPMIIKLNENLTTREPVCVKAAQLNGIYSAKLTWNAPLANAEGVTGYNIYRDGVKIQTVSPTTFMYIDSSLSKGNHTYEVTALYNATESAKSLTAEIEIQDKKVSAPVNLYAVQSGINNVRLGWNAPRSNRIIKSYFEPEDEISGFGGGDNSFESAIRFSKEEIAAYKNHLITNIVFYPMVAQEKWTITIYKGNDALYTEDIDGTTLKIGMENNIKLNQSVAVPTDSDISLGIKVKVNNPGYNIIGMVFGKKVAAYSDLVRLEGEDDFYSLYEASQTSGGGSYDYSLSWAMGMLLSGPNESTDIDKIKGYNVYVGGTKLGETEKLSYLHKDLTDGTYKYEVEAVYANEVTSPKTSAEIIVKKNEECYKAVSNVNAKVTGNQLVATWETPVNDDETFITYANNTPSKGLVGPETTNYNYMLGSKYGKDKMNKYIGYQIKSFRFYPLSEADFTFYLKANNEIVHTEEVIDYTPNTWNTVVLDNPITIQEGTEYFLMLDCFDVTPKAAPVALDSQVGFDGISDLYSTDEGENFSSAHSEASANGNWMIGMVITSPETSSLPVKGYNVEIDGTKMNTELLTETRYEQIFESDVPDETHRMNVNVVYEVVGEKRGNAVFFTINSTGIDKNLIPSVSVYPNPATSYVKVDGNVESIVAYTIGGTEVARSNENTLNVSNLQTGLYILKISIDGQEISAKVNIAR